MADDLLVEIRERYPYAKDAWADVRKEGATDMAYVSGNPWTPDDDKQRKDRPTVAPEEMSQYRNQVINALMANPRGMKFSATGNGANDKGAQFYNNKAREIEYRSHAKLAYLTAADCALQRSYGFVRVETRYASPRSANQEIWIEPFPDPDMVLPDPDAKRPDSSDQQFCFVLQWTDQKEFARTKRGKAATIQNISDFSHDQPNWVQGTKVLQAEYWKIETRPRKLLLVQPPAPQGPSGYQIAPPPMQAPRPLELFDDELAKMPPGATIIRELRTVDYPTVKMYLTNGLEILSEHAWPGKYIPIVSCYGKMLYVPTGGEVKRVILSMTRFGRDPWKSYCYACSQELEVLAMVPKAPLLLYEGQMDSTQLNALAESMHRPVAAITFKGVTAATGQQLLPVPQRADYLQGQYLQAIEEVKEGFRRAIQSAMGSNFLPTQAQKRNEKSGKALDKMEQAATQGTYHFVNSYEDLIRHVGIICEDLMDKIYSQAGDTGVMEADGKATTIRINDPQDKEAVDTAGDYLVTVSTAPSSDSEREAAADFTDTLVGELQMIASVSGPKVAAAVLARAIRLRNLGPLGDQLADLIEPMEFKTKDGQQPQPELVAAQGQIQHLTQLLQQAAQEKQCKVIENQGKFAIEKMKVEATSEDKAAERELKLAMTEIAALKDRQTFYEERLRLGLQLAHEERMARHDHATAHRDRVHESIENVKDRTHEALQADLAHDRAKELGAQGVAGQIATQQHAADLAPDPAAAE
jgi:hypothetical protein